MDAKKHMLIVTKRYIIEFLNSLLFANTVLWDGIDQYNELPILSEGSSEQEQRGALLISKSGSTALRLVVTTSTLAQQSVCYRLVSPVKEVKLPEIHKIFYPFKSARIDFSIADLNLGKEEVSSYSFCDNTTSNGSITPERLFSFLKFLITSDVYTYDYPQEFADILDVLSLPPCSTDPQYIPVFGIKE